MASNDLSPNGNIGNNALKNFQLSGNTEDKTDKKFGERIIIQVEDIINGGYFSQRNARFALNRAMAAGRMDMKKFMTSLI